jgi:hypothetical protein
MKPRKQAVLSAGTAEFPGIVENPILFENWGIKTGSGGRLVSPESRQARTRRQAGREQGLKILAREANNIAARNVPTSQAKRLWDCTTREAALAGTSVSAGAIVFVRRNPVSGSSYPQPVLCGTEHLPSPTRILFCTANESDAGRY